MSRKFSKSLLFLFLIILFGVAGYLIVNTKNSPLSEQIEVQATSTEYRNNEYGFRITLPLSWKGYTLVNDIWKAYSPDKPQGNTPDETGPLLAVRNPLWSTSTPRQDIPIMVFTIAQWDLLTHDKIHIGAAPINPSELGRNGSYVFALPARYNYAFPVGYEEVDAILQTKPLRGF